MTLKELRKFNNLTQIECAKYLGIPRRTYQNYESDETRVNSLKYKYMIQKLEKYNYIDESSGILTIELIKKTCYKIFSNRNIDFCYLFIGQRLNVGRK